MSESRHVPEPGAAGEGPMTRCVPGLMSALVRLQMRAATFCAPIPLTGFLRFRVLLVVGGRNPWRLLETTFGAAGQASRMLCFRTMERLHSAIEERYAWLQADAAFVATHMTTPGGFPGVTADWTHSSDFDLVFGPQRRDLRQDMCITTPDEVATTRHLGPTGPAAGTRPLRWSASIE
jgi:hypothetical protein